MRTVRGWAIGIGVVAALTTKCTSNNAGQNTANEQPLKGNQVEVPTAAQRLDAR